MHKLRLLLAMAVLTSAAPLRAEEHNPEMVAECVSLATAMNRSTKLRIDLRGITPHYTWRSACAERPPSGPGNVVALCEGQAVFPDGRNAPVFFWSKSHQGKAHTGYYPCR